MHDLAPDAKFERLSIRRKISEDLSHGPGAMNLTHIEPAIEDELTCMLGDHTKALFALLQPQCCLTLFSDVLDRADHLCNDTRFVPDRLSLHDHVTDTFHRMPHPKLHRT